MARLCRTPDLANASLHGPPKAVFHGPLLAKALFPQVLVAKAVSIDGAKLDLVMYNGKDAGTFSLDVERLIPHLTYNLSTGGSVTADTNGKATFKTKVSGRTQIILTPA